VYRLPGPPYCATVLERNLRGRGHFLGIVIISASRAAEIRTLRGDLERLASKSIPVDIVFEQGVAVLGLGR
jgi:hypothetical protein